MTHDYHEALAGYAEGQLLVDGCGECGERSARSDHGLSELDPIRQAVEGMMAR